MNGTIYGENYNGIMTRLNLGSTVEDRWMQSCVSFVDFRFSRTFRRWIRVCCTVAIFAGVCFGGKWEEAYEERTNWTTSENLP
jgi:hypothetical protein